MTATDKLSELLAAATPGPRYVEAQSIYAEGDGVHKLIARAFALEHNVSWPECEANAALISMAPDLAADVIRLRAENADRDKTIAELVAANTRLVEHCDELAQSADEQRTADYRAWQEAEYRAWKAEAAK